MSVQKQTEMDADLLRLKQIFTAAMKETFPNGWFGYNIKISVTSPFQGGESVLYIKVAPALAETNIRIISIHDDVDAVLAAGQVKEAILDHTKDLIEEFSRPSNFRIESLLPQLLLLSSLGFDRDYVRNVLKKVMAFYRWEEGNKNTMVVTFYRRDAVGSILLGEITLHRRDGDSLRWAVRFHGGGKGIISESGRTENVSWELPNHRKGTNALECFADQLMDFAGL